MAWFGAVFLLVIVGASPAQAQDEDVEDPRARAHLLYEESEAAYRQGRFEDAAELLRAAYQTHPEPVLLYNLGRALDGAGELEEAVESYESYLSEAGEIEDRGAIEQRLESLRRILAEREELEQRRRDRDEVDRQELPPDEEPAGDVRGANPVPWIVAGIGAIGMGIGAVLGVMALGRHDDADGAPSQEEAQLEQGSAEDLATGANIALVVGGVIALGGVIWGVLDLTMGSSDVAVAITPMGISVSGAL